MNSNETLILLSDTCEEWYTISKTCSACRIDFMCGDPKFCPGCGRKIIGTKQGKETIYYGKGEDQ